MVFLAVISTEPALPRPNVLAETSPPLVRVREPVVILTPPASPSASEPT